LYRALHKTGLLPKNVRQYARGRIAEVLSLTHAEVPAGPPRAYDAECDCLDGAYLVALACVLRDKAAVARDQWRRMLATM
jgi:hypothetical protein